MVWVIYPQQATLCLGHHEDLEGANNRKPRADPLWLCPTQESLVGGEESVTGRISRPPPPPVYSPCTIHPLERGWGFNRKGLGCVVWQVVGVTSVIKLLCDPSAAQEGASPAHQRKADGLV